MKRLLAHATGFSILTGLFCAQLLAFPASHYVQDAPLPQRALTYYKPDSGACTVEKFKLPDEVVITAKRVADIFQHVDIKSLSLNHQQMIRAYWNLVRNGQNTLLRAVTTGITSIDLDDISDQSLLPYLLQQQLPEIYDTFKSHGMPDNQINQVAIDFWLNQTEAPLVTPKGQIVGCPPYVHSPGMGRNSHRYF